MDDKHTFARDFCYERTRISIVKGEISSLPIWLGRMESFIWAYAGWRARGADGMMCAILARGGPRAAANGETP